MIGWGGGISSDCVISLVSPLSTVDPLFVAGVDFIPTSISQRLQFGEFSRKRPSILFLECMFNIANKPNAFPLSPMRPLDTHRLRRYCTNISSEGLDYPSRSSLSHLG